MATGTEKATRTPLSRERVLQAAITLADEGGIGAMTMRGLAASLDVEAMSLYYHVENKEALLDGIADAVVQEINAEVAMIETRDGGDWQVALRDRILAARRVMLRHRWAPGVLETRTTMNPSVLVYYNGVVEIFRDGGFSFDLIHHAMHALGSRALGFSQELFNPEAGSGDQDASDETLEALAPQIPFLVEMIGHVAHDDPGSTIGWCDDQTEFEFSVDAMLNGLEALRLADSG
jgi:AcrR family transcriptional regulator